MLVFSLCDNNCAGSKWNIVLYYEADSQYVTKTVKCQKLSNSFI